MPRITNVRPHERRPGWYEVQLDGASCILLPDDVLAGHGLDEGSELDDETVERIRIEGQTAEASRIALRYLSVRPRSRREVELRLRREGAGPEATARTVDRLLELGYLDDPAFAAAFTRDRIRLKPCGLRRLRSELRSRGVSAEDAEAGIFEALSEEETTEAELLERAAAARARRIAGADPRVAKRRLFAFLARRGFDPGEARAWVERWASSEERDPDRAGD